VGVRVRVLQRLRCFLGRHIERSVGLVVDELEDLVGLFRQGGD
jgi:hypothetical protein